MESNHSSINPNQLLNQYVYQMESEIGCSGKTLHQIVSEYLKLKAQYSSLTQQAEDLEIPSADVISADQFEHWIGKLRRFQDLRRKTLQGMNSPAEHPWHGIVYCDPKPEEYDTLLRTVRFLSIQLNKLWVEIQSVPPFLNALDRTSVLEIERIFRWLLQSPNWNEMIAFPRIIPFLAHIESRKVLLDFARDVKSVRILRSKIEAQISNRFIDSSLIEEGISLITEGVGIIERYQLATTSRKILEAKVKDIEEKSGRLEKIQTFFANLFQHKQYPSENRIPRTLNEVRSVFRASILLSKVPRRVLSMRDGKVLEPGQTAKIEAWKKLANNILEVRKKLGAYFRLEEPFSADELRKLAADLSAAGALRSFSASYQAALHRYQSLLKVDMHHSTRKKKRETPAEMSSRLQDWATYLDQVKNFETQSEARQFFGSSFKGIDTDFDLACQANAWFSQLKADLNSETDAFSKLWVDFSVEASESSVQSLTEALSDDAAREVEECAKGLDLLKDDKFSEISEVLKTEALELKRLLSILDRLGIQLDVQLNCLEEQKRMMEEVVFLCNRIESNGELKQWLKSAYRGSDTDLGLIEQGLVYVQYIESADIPDTLKETFISGYGPQRMSESRNLVSSAWTSLETLKDLFQKLEICTHGQTKGLIASPVSELLTRIQQALKQPTMIHDWVEYLQCERDVRVLGLGSLLDYCEKRSLFGWPLDQIFEFAYIASLLKGGIQSANKSARLTSSSPCNTEEGNTSGFSRRVF